jgi:zinc protease
MKFAIRLVRNLGAASIAIVSSLAAAALPANVEHVETFRGVAQYRLRSNDMTIVVVPNHASPVVTFMVVYHVGSRNEGPGNTGSAHLLEHMIFNRSTENFGRANGHKTFQEVLHEAGADFASSNMTTWYDRMNGFSTVPSDKLELAMKIEADRLGRGLVLDSERKTEMSVVRNEFEISENDPLGALFKATIGTAFQAHPYRWSVLGYRSDIEGVTTEKLREHYKTFFWPNNAAAVLVGDFDLEKALTLFDREFGGFKKAPHPIPDVITVEPPQEGERRIVVRRPGSLAYVMVGYMRPGATHPDFHALDVLQAVLSRGANSRLSIEMIEKGFATSAQANLFEFKDPFPFLISAAVAPGRTHAEVEATIKKIVADVARDGITDAELARARRQIEVDFVREIDGPFRYARLLGQSIAVGSWKRALTHADNINAVTAADVKRVAAAYLVPDCATVGWFVPDDAAKRPAVIPAASSNVNAGQPARPATPASALPVTSAADTPRTFAERTVRRVLPNGITLDIVENRAAPTFALRGIVIGGDSAAPPGQRVLPALLAKVLERGSLTRTREQIGALLDDVGATRGYGTTPYDTSINAGGMSRDLELILDVVADELLNPAIKPEELAKSKRELENDILRADDNTSARAIERLGQLVFPKSHPYHPFDRAEKLAGLAAITDADIRAFHRRNYSGTGLILAIVGDVDAAQVADIVNRKFGALPSGVRWTPEPAGRLSLPERPAREAVTMRGKANMNIVMGEPSGLTRRHPDYEAALIANAVLGQTALASRIGRRVRDTEGLSYSLASRYAFMEDLDGMWYVTVNVAPQNLVKALASTRDEIERYAREGATDAEVEVQKTFFAGNFRVNLGSNGGIADSLVYAERHGFGPAYLDSYPARIATVTTAMANAALRKYFAPEKLHVIVAGDLDRLPDLATWGQSKD